MNPGACVNFRGVQHQCCEAGVDWAAEFGTFRVAPCVMFIARQGKGTYIDPNKPWEKGPSLTKREEHEVKNCPFFRLPTLDEMKADHAEHELFMERFMLGIKVAGQWRVKPKPAEDRQGIVDCPACMGKLHLSQSSYNGHVHGRCETPGCLEWME